MGNAIEILEKGHSLVNLLQKRTKKLCKKSDDFLVV